MPSALACISHVPISWCSKWPHLEMESCWTLSKHPHCSHILHTCQPSYSPQRHQTDNHIGWAWTSLLFSSAPKSAHALITWTKVNVAALIPSRCIFWKGCIIFSGCSILHIFCKLLIPCKNVQLHCAFAAISAFTTHDFSEPSPARVSSSLNPKPWTSLFSSKPYTLNPKPNSTSLRCLTLTLLI